MPRWLTLALLGVGGLLVLAIGVWLLMGGTATIMRWMPEGVAKTLGEKPGEGKKVEQKLSDYPGDPQGAGSDQENAAGASDLPTSEAVDAALAAVMTQVEAADEAITRVRGGHGRDQAVIAEAEKAVQAIGSTPLGECTRKVKQAAEEKRRALVAQKQTALDAAKRLARATHLVMSETSLRAAADSDSEQVAKLQDGVLVQVHLDTGKGWSRADVISGPATGKAGYVLDAVLKKLAQAAKK